MKLDTSRFLTIEEVGEAIGGNKRAAYRAIKRAQAAGHAVTVEIFGSTVVPRAALKVLKEFYFPYGSPAHQRAVVEWGRRGGTQKKLNRLKRASASGRSGEPSANLPAPRRPPQGRCREG